jgi:hypothetical protein
MQLLKKGCIPRADSSNSIFVRIPELKVVRMAVCPVTRDSDVDHCIFPLNPGFGEELIKHPASLVARYLDWDRIWSSNVVLGVYVHYASLSIRFSVVAAR